ncbi:M48 family metallopeptidase [Ilumatobacter sp.]|uniref:M48 family metallopeptidase n=1 Tax=Ilumatobacter sp. TaxID=1967498 RepID=UPI003B51ED4A
MSAGIHALDSLTAGDLVFTIAPPTDRTTLEITVDRDASLILRAPTCASRERVERFIESKRPWVYRKLAEKDALVAPPIRKQFVDGEGFAYLGRNYRLKIDDTIDGVRLDRGRFLMSTPTADGDAAMRRWYVRTGQAWLQRRVEPWASRMGATDVDVAVRDLGYRWGSTRGETHINIHWATLQLAPSLIDYVIVHELAHLKELNHTDRYWAEVARGMPDYERRREELTTAGVKIWTCR